jgi:hypothetical protein
MSWSRILKEALLSNDVPTEPIQQRAIVAIEINGVLFEVLKFRAQQKDTNLLPTRHLG